MLGFRCGPTSSISSLPSTSRQWAGCSAASMCKNAHHVAPRSNSRAPRVQVVCMAHPRRVAKVAAQVQREISDMLVYDSVLQNAMSPERATGEDMQLSVVPSVTHVYVSNDLQVVKIYLSIYSDDFGKKRAMSNLKRLEPYVRREMGQRVSLRLTPEYRFEYDDSIDEMELVQKVIGEEDVARFKRELAVEQGEVEEGEEAEGVEGSASAGAAEAFGDDLENDDDEGFFGMDDVGEQEYEEVSSADVFNRPGPFDDLFTGDGDQLVQAGAWKEQGQDGPRKRRSKGKGKGSQKSRVGV